MLAPRTAASAIAGSVLLALLASAPALAEPRWTEATQLGMSARDLDVTANPAGDQVAVFARDGKVNAAYRPAGGGWSPQELVRRDAYQAHAFIDRDGNASAVWLRNGVWHVSDRQPDGHWTLDTTAPLGGRRGLCVGDSAMAGDLAGNLVLTWTETDCDDTASWTRLAWRFPDGTWAEVRDEQDGAEVAALTVDDGVATMVGRSQGAVWWRTSTRGGEPTEPQVLLDADGVPDIASNARGDILVGATDTSNDSGRPMSRLVTRAKPVGEEWQGEVSTAWQDGPASKRRPTDTIAAPASVAVNDDGLAAAIYDVDRPTGDTDRPVTKRALVAVGRVETSAWSEPVDVSGDLGYIPTAPQIAVAPDGTVAASWTTSTDKVRYSAAYVARRPAGTQEWKPPAKLGYAYDQAPKVVGHPNGRLTAAWGGTQAMYSDYVEDTVAPTTRMEAPSQEFVTSTKLEVSWESTDDIGAVGNTDGRVRSAGHVGPFSAWSGPWNGRNRRSMTYAGEPGRTYCFSARGTDPSGNVGDWSRQRCTTTPLDDRAFERGPGWTRGTNRAAYQDTLTTTSQRGARLRLARVKADSLRIVARTCPTCGKVRVTHHGRNLGVFTLTSRPTRDMQVILVSDYSRVRRGPLVIRVVSDGKPVRIDGVIASR